MQAPKKVVVLGPESTGKSTLCAQLAAHYHTNWIPEFARKYLMELGRPYNYDDLLIIARGQIESETDLTKRNSDRILFIDTDMYVMKVWCEFVFGKCHPFILDQIVERTYDLYLLCNTDLPWTKDELREYPDIVNRNKLFRIYKDLMINQHTPWVEIRGLDDERIRQAIESVDAFLLQ
ncbi:MAG: AAA family ATPase [Bacteroidota bacterium]|nr:AAA family ATPase [Bacteroidota bacterium]MDP4214229.1 AAA family ATPase [Bacteroidota bacterium]MDP4248854.1 AAA family ATPase [Bacteroidota bacterium]